MPERHLPPLPAGPLSLASARERGLLDHDWRDARLLRLTRGVRSLHQPVDLADRARAFALALPDDVAFSHVTAARLWGLPLPLRLERDGPLDVMRASDRGRIVRNGCRSHKGLERRDTTRVDGFALTTVAHTWIDLANLSGTELSVEDLVVAGDAAVARWALPGRSRTADELAGAVRPLLDALEDRGRVVGRARLVEALRRVRPGVRSPQESRVRCRLVDAGLPEPETCVPVTARDGGWLAEGDLVWRRQRVVGEYQGAVHAGITARSADAYRNGQLTDEDWTVIEIYAEDVSDTHRWPALVHRFARALDVPSRALRLPENPPSR